MAAEPHLSFLKDLPLARVAVSWAFQRHRGQLREADGAAFVVHPMEVASLLEEARYPDQVVAAGVLHDVLEDTATERDEIEVAFGREVADLVEAVSDDPAIEGEEEQKSEVRDRVRRRGGYAAAIYAADKVSKVRELRTRIATGAAPDEVAAKLARYRKSLAMLDEAIPGSHLVELLRFELEALEQLPPRPRRL